MNFKSIFLFFIINSCFLSTSHCVKIKNNQTALPLSFADLKEEFQKFNSSSDNSCDDHKALLLVMRSFLLAMYRDMFGHHLNHMGIVRVLLAPINQTLHNTIADFCYKESPLKRDQKGVSALLFFFAPLYTNHPKNKKLFSSKETNENFYPEQRFSNLCNNKENMPSFLREILEPHEPIYGLLENMVLTKRSFNIFEDYHRAKNSESKISLKAFLQDLEKTTMNDPKVIGKDDVKNSISNTALKEKTETIVRTEEKTVTAQDNINQENISQENINQIVSEQDVSEKDVSEQEKKSSFEKKLDKLNNTQIEEFFKLSSPQPQKQVGPDTESLIMNNQDAFKTSAQQPLTSLSEQKPKTDELSLEERLKRYHTQYQEDLKQYNTIESDFWYDIKSLFSAKDDDEIAPKNWIKELLHGHIKDRNILISQGFQTQCNQYFQNNAFNKIYTVLDKSKDKLPSNTGIVYRFIKDFLQKNDPKISDHLSSNAVEQSFIDDVVECSMDASEFLGLEEKNSIHQEDAKEKQNSSEGSQGIIDIISKYSMDSSKILELKEKNSINQEEVEKKQIHNDVNNMQTKPPTRLPETTDYTKKFGIF